MFVPQWQCAPFCKREGTGLVRKVAGVLLRQPVVSIVQGLLMFEYYTACYQWWVLGMT
jgi:hypothetical protein